MSHWDSIEAQVPAITTLRRAVDEERIASAYLFEGPSGVGKERAALALARAVVAGGDEAILRRIDESNHPDVRIFRPRSEGAGNLQVEVLRKDILPLAQYAPFEAEATFFLFPDADVSFPDTHPEAANALLKTLEEPRAGVHFLLLSERPDRLLPTIRSRCQSVRFRRLPAHLVERILVSHEVAEEERAVATALADGRADRALALAQGGTGRALLERALAVDAAIESGKPGSLVDAAESLSRGDDLPLALDALAAFYRDVAALALGLPEEGLAFRHAGKALRARARTLPPGRAAGRAARIREAREALERNANAQITMDALVFDLRRVL